MTATALNTKAKEVEKNIPDHAKYITTPEFNKLTVEDFAARLNQADLVNKTNFDNKITSFSKRSTSNKTKYLKVQKKLNSLVTKDYNFFLVRIYFTSNGGSQNTFVYQSKFDTLELKKRKGTDHALSCKSIGICNSKLKSLHTFFLDTTKLFGYKMRVRFDKDLLVVAQNNYLSKIVNVYIVYDLDTWPKIPLGNFTKRNCLFGATTVVKNCDKK